MTTGLAFLHSFQYDEAGQAFNSALREDSHCALAGWGKAMSLYHQLWDFPNSATLALGRRYIDQAKELGTNSAREREYIGAADVFYRAASLTPAARVGAYSAAMNKLYQDQPEDNEAGELYALSLVSLAQMGVQDFANRKKAISILDAIFAAHPNDPGAAHYLIHACDVRELAPHALAAARAYARIAPDSAHALHMPSHIFRRLGLWQEVIDSNLASAAAAAKATEEHRGDASYQFHAMDFLDYAYLQSGQESKARRLIAELKDVPEGGAANIIEQQNEFAARNAIELHRWKEAAELAIPNERFEWQDYTYWTRAIGASRSKDAASAEADVQKLTEIDKLRRMHQNDSGAGMAAAPSIDLTEAEAWLAYAQGTADEALAKLRSAADREDGRDAEPFAVPAREMLADMLLELQRPSEALREYESVLKLYPNRFNTLYGAAKAADSAGNHAMAIDFYKKLIAICPPAADRPELQSARRYITVKVN
jgi:tetratricopeptide (TPR) repeat protein